MGGALPAIADGEDNAISSTAELAEMEFALSREIGGPHLQVVEADLDEAGNVDTVSFDLPAGVLEGQLLFLTGGDGREFTHCVEDFDVAEASVTVFVGESTDWYGNNETTNSHCSAHTFEPLRTPDKRLYLRSACLGKA